MANWHRQPHHPPRVLEIQPHSDGQSFTSDIFNFELHVSRIKYTIHCASSKSGASDVTHGRGGEFPQDLARCPQHYGGVSEQNGVLKIKIKSKHSGNLSVRYMRCCRRAPASVWVCMCVCVRGVAADWLRHSQFIPESSGQATYCPELYVRGHAALTTAHPTPLPRGHACEFIKISS